MNPFYQIAARKLPIVPVWTALISLATAATALGAGEVPFQGSFNTVHHDTFGFDPAAGPTVAVEVAGEGQASHLGRATAFTNDQLGLLASGEITATYSFTAANGDTLEIEFFGELGVLDPVAQRVEFTATFTIIGGTGRFAGATGEGTSSGWAVFDQPLDEPTNSGPGFFSLNGVISSPGSAKR